MDIDTPVKDIAVIDLRRSDERSLFGSIPGKPGCIGAIGLLLVYKGLPLELLDAFQSFMLSSALLPSPSIHAWSSVRPVQA